MTRRGAVGILATVLVVVSAPAAGAGASEWRESAATLLAGQTDGIAVTSGSRFFLAPSLEPLGRAPEGNGPPAQVWALTADRAGNVFLGTGPDGRILRIEPSGRTTTFFRVDEPLVTALEVLPDGRLLAGTAPEGKIYRIDASGNGQEWCRTGERYVWDLTTGADGRVFAATGEKGVVLRIKDDGTPEPFFDSVEAHVVRLLALPQGGLLAAGGSLGLVYEIDPSGHGLVLYDDSLPEVSDLAIEDDGSVIAAAVAPPPAAPRRPEVRIRLPETVEVGAAQGQMEDLQDETAPKLEGVIEGLETDRVSASRALRGRVVRIRPDGGIEELWRSTEEAPYAVLAAGDRRVLFGTGEPARLYRWEANGEVALLATRPQAQVTALLRVGRNELLATSNPGEAFRIDWSSGQAGVFVSAPVDAGGPARWGKLRWSTGAGPGQVEMFTRTGNSAQPDDTWSGWGPAMTNPSGATVTNPDGRFLQWRLKITPGTRVEAPVRDVHVSYARYNRPPRIRGLSGGQGGPGGSYRTAVTLSWQEADPDGDPLRSTVEIRPVAGGEWRQVATAAEVDPPKDAETWISRSAVWPIAEIAEGVYEVRVLVSDRHRNIAAEGADAVQILDRPVRIDRTPPEMEPEPRSGGWVITVRDAVSAVDRLEVVEGDEVRFLAAPEDGVCDSAEERFTVALPSGVSSSGWSVRAVDEAGNAVEQGL